MCKLLRLHRDLYRGAYSQRLDQEGGEDTTARIICSSQASGCLPEATGRYPDTSHLPTKTHNDPLFTCLDGRCDTIYVNVQALESPEEPEVFDF